MCIFSELPLQVVSKYKNSLMEIVRCVTQIMIFVFALRFTNALSAVFTINNNFNKKKHLLFNYAKTNLKKKSYTGVCEADKTAFNRPSLSLFTLFPVQMETPPTSSSFGNRRDYVLDP